MTEGIEKEVSKLYKKLNKYNEQKDYSSMENILTILSEKPMTVEVLQTTKVGAKINNLRQSIEHKDVKKQMRNLIKQWKALTEGKPPAPVSVSSTKIENGHSKIEEYNHVQPGEIVHSNGHGNNQISNSTNNEIQPDKPGFTTPIHYSGDTSRDKARDLLGKALRSQFPEPLHSACNRCAVQLEIALHDQNPKNTKKYKVQLMSKISNLKDPKNPNLRQSFINGLITAERLATMTTQEMMSDELKQKNEKFEKENLSEAQTAVNAGTETDMFVCGKCKGKKCTYTQLQTRSSDEPMTTFVFCMDCGNRWKFC